MQDQRIPLSDEILNLKPRKKKTSSQKASLFQLQGNDVKDILQGPILLKNGHKPLQKKTRHEGSPSFQKQERSNSDSLPDSSTSGNEYRALRHKYLMLEEESCQLGVELREVEDEIKTLEDEKISLLDQLVVLEGLVDPSEFQSQ